MASPSPSTPSEVTNHTPDNVNPLSDDAPSGDTPAPDTRDDDIAHDNTSIQDTPGCRASIDNHRADDTSADNTSSSNTPCGNDPVDRTERSSTLLDVTTRGTPKRPSRLGIGLAGIANRLPLEETGITTVAHRAPFSAVAKLVTGRLNRTEEKPAILTDSKYAASLSPSYQQPSTAEHIVDKADAATSIPDAPTSLDAKNAQTAIPSTSVALPTDSGQTPSYTSISLTQPGSSTQAHGTTDTEFTHTDSVGIRDIPAKDTQAETVLVEATRAKPSPADTPQPETPTAANGEPQTITADTNSASRNKKQDSSVGQTPPWRSMSRLMQVEHENEQHDGTPVSSTADTNKDAQIVTAGTLRQTAARVLALCALHGIAQAGPTTDTNSRKDKRDKLKGLEAQAKAIVSEEKHQIVQDSKTTRPSTTGQSDLFEADIGSPSKNHTTSSPEPIQDPSKPSSSEDISDRTAMYDKLLTVARYITIPAAKCKSNFVAKHLFPCLSNKGGQPGGWTEDEEEEVARWVAKGLTLMAKGGFT